MSVLDPLAAVYGAGVAARLAAYRRGLLPVRRAGRPVLSVGNVAAGGTGKTPFVRWLAGELLARGFKPSILTRGYGRKSRGTVVVSDGAGVLASVRDAGDEPALLARALPSVPIVADGRRARAASAAETLAPATTLHLLDDGFSHVALARDLDVVLLDATAPDAGGALLPAGRLREPLASLARADLLVITKTEQADPARARELAARYAPGVPVYHAATRVLGIRDAAGLAIDPADLPGATCVAVAGLARPEAFLADARGSEDLPRGLPRLPRPRPVRPGRPRPHRARRGGVGRDRRRHDREGRRQARRAPSAARLPRRRRHARRRARVRRRGARPPRAAPVLTWPARAPASATAQRRSPSPPCAASSPGCRPSARKPSGAASGSLYRRVDGRRRELARANIARAFPEMSPAEGDALSRAVFAHFGGLATELLHAAGRPVPEIVARVEFPDAGIAREALRSGRGVLFLTAHLGNWEYSAIAMAAAGVTASVVARPLDNPLLDAWLTGFRTSNGNAIIEKHDAARGMLKALRSGGVLGVLADQHVGPPDGIPAPFFGRPASTTSALARIVDRTEALVLPAAADPARAVALPPRRGVRPRRAEPAGRRARGRAAHRAVQRDPRAGMIRRHPEQWLWLHNRWRLD